MKASILILFILIFQPVSGQNSATISHKNASVTLKEAAEKKFEQGKFVEASMLTEEALEEAFVSASPDLVVSSALLKFRISQSTNQFNKSMEAVHCALAVSEDASPEYRQSVLLNAIKFFETNDMLENSRELINEALELNLENQEVKMRLLASKAKACLVSYDEAGALASLLELKNMAKDSKDNSYILQTLNSIGTIYVKQGKYELAIPIFKEYNLVASWQQLESEKAIGLNNIALCYQQMKEFNASSDLFNQALESCEKNSKTYTEIMMNLAYLEKDMGRLELAQNCVEVTLINAEKLNDMRLLAKAKIMMASIIHISGDDNSAIALASTALDICNTNNDYDLAEEAIKFLKKIYTNKNDRENDEKCNAFIELINKEKAAENRMVLLKKSVSETEMSQLDKAARSEWNRRKTDQFDAEKSELDNANKEKSMALMKAEQELIKSEYERSKIEKEKAQKELSLAQASLLGQKQQISINELEKAKTGQMLELANLQIERQNQRSQLEMAKRHNALLTSEAQLYDAKVKNEQAAKKLGYTISGFAFLAFIVSAVVLRSLRSKNKRIATNNDALNKVNKEVMDSITSASQFQASIIPSEERMRNIVGDGFIYYKPMDIVSGDLPFMYHTGNKLYVAAIDCIGHGVPAAMLTFITHYNLKDIIDKKSSLKSGEILTALHLRMVETLKQHSENPDFLAGIDISFCAIDIPSREIEFAGAQLPLLIVDKNGAQQLKGDLYSVADLYMDKTPDFKTHTRKLESGDSIILLSDGFVHQHGGVDGRKKFSFKELRNLLEKNIGKSMPQLKNILHQAFCEWKGNHPQTDDVMVLGITLN